MLCVGICVTITIYAAIIMPYFLRITEELDTYNPRAIQVGAFSGFMSFIT
jgi:hypothetical protein